MKEIYYFDTSVLVRYYTNETGSDLVKTMVDSESTEIFISSWAIVEAHSALKSNMFRQGLDKKAIHLIKKVYSQTTTTLLWDILNKKFLLEDLPNNYYQRASELIKEYGVMKEMSMKKGDAVQIVGFEKLLQNFPTAIFVSADEGLIKVVKEISYEHIFISPNSNNL
ncbi:MAG: type II toxin-antitoxin system VapC family toxin [Leptospiraceae bacterium]|nr:type II toxin-antitoxin system VapC family toxin [Leptospiraceae bacterium]